MTDFKFQCPHCQQKLQCNEKMSGRQIVCPACSHLITIPAVPGRTVEHKPEVGNTWATFPPRSLPKKPDA
jgi:DNA-directed RNA polymerase subunit RPC12/RpoP